MRRDEHPASLTTREPLVQTCRAELHKMFGSVPVKSADEDQCPRMRAD